MMVKRRLTLMLAVAAAALGVTLSAYAADGVCPPGATPRDDDDCRFGVLVSVPFTGFINLPTPPAAPTPAPEPRPALSENLLVNPGFEEPYYRIATDEGGGAIANGWTAWWFNDEGNVFSVPEYEIAPLSRDPFRVREGFASQQIFRPSVLWKAGVYQQVQVPAGTTVRFSVWGHSWSTFCNTVVEGERICDYHNSDRDDSGNPFFMKVGIDPTGGTDGLSPNIVWSEEKIAWDEFEEFTVEATAQGSTITVFTYGAPYFAAVINNDYWDDASLVIIAQPE